MQEQKLTLSPAVMVIYPADLAKIPGWEHLSPRTQNRYFQRMLDFAGKQRPQPLTLGDLAAWINCPGEDLIPVFFPHFCQPSAQRANAANR